MTFKEVRLCIDIGSATGSYGRVNESEKILAVSVVAGILAANRTNVPRWDETAAKQALGLVNEVDRLLASEGLSAESPGNLTEASIAHLKALGQNSAGLDAGEPGDGEDALLSFVELTQRLDPANWNKRARREKTFRDYVCYSMARTSEARRLLEEEDLPVAGSNEPPATEIDERMVELKARRFAASQVKDIEADFMRFLQAVQ